MDGADQEGRQGEVQRYVQTARELPGFEQHPLIRFTPRRSIKLEIARREEVAEALVEMILAMKVEGRAYG